MKERVPIRPGDRFGNLIAIRLSSRDKRGRANWIFACNCDGNEKEYAGYAVKSGNTQSCGCIQKKRASEANTTHGHSRDNQPNSPEFRSWASMMNRCSNPNADNYSWYGGIGIRVVERWKKFENFLADVGSRPQKTTLGRLLDKGNYGPGNAFWMSSKEQSEQAYLKTVAWG